MVTIHKPIQGISQRALSRFIRNARRAAGIQGQVNVSIVSSRTVQALNRQYRRKNKPTDVLSFPAMPVVAPRFAGDIVISADIALRHAREYGHELSDELKILIVHGLLHLAGMDHETDSGYMARREERLRRTLRLSDSLIRRVRGGSAKTRRTP